MGQRHSEYEWRTCKSVIICILHIIVAYDFQIGIEFVPVDTVVNDVFVCLGIPISE